MIRSLVSLVVEAIRLELALYRSLLRWVVRRPDVPQDATPIGYAQLAGPMLWLWILGSATEVVVVEVVLRQIDAGWAVLLVGVSSLTNLELRLTGSFLLRTSKGDITASRIGLWVDDPRGVARRLRTPSHVPPS